MQGAINQISGLSTVANGATHKFTDMALVQQYANSLKGLNLQQAQLALSTKMLSDNQKEQILVQAGLKASDDAIQAELLQTTLEQKGLSVEKQRAILIELGLMDATTFELFAEKTCTKEKLKGKLAQELKNKTDERGILTTLGLGEANLFTAETFKLMGEQALMALKAIATNPITWVIAGIVATIGVVDLLTTSMGEARESFEALEEVTNELESTQSELTSINDKIAEIQSKGKLELTDKIELQKLETERSILEDQVRLLELKKELAANKSNKDAVDAANSAFKGFSYGDDWYDGFTDDETRLRNILGMSTNSDGVIKISEFGGVLQRKYENLEKIKSQIANETDEEKLIKLYEKKQNIENNINKDKTQLSNVYSNNLELLEQITGDDPVSVATRKKLESQNELMAQYIFSAEEIAQKNLTRFKEKFASNYNANLDLIQNDSNHKRSVNDTAPRKDSEGYGTIARSGVTEEGLDSLIAKNKELNQSFVDGKITTSEYFDNLSSEIEKINLDDVGKVLDGGKGDNSKTDYIEEVVANLAGQVSDALMYADQSFKVGETSVSDYIDTLDSGIDAQKKLLKSTYDLEEGENGLVKAVDESDLAAKNAADGFNDLVEAQEGLDAVDEFADKMESYNEKLMQFVENDTTITDAILGDPELFNTHMDNVTDSLVSFANASEENFNTVAQQLQNSLGVTQEKAEELIRSGGDAIQSQAGQNMDAVNKLTDNAMANTSGAVTNASQAIGGVLSALGEAISGFTYNIKATPYIEGDFDFTIEDGKPKLSLASFGFDISGSGGSSAANLSKALSNAGTYFSNTGSTDSDSISSYGSNKGNKSDTTASPSGGGSKGSSSGSKKDPAKEAEEKAKKELEALKTSLDTRKEILDRYKDAVDLTDFGLDLAEENDFALRADLLNNKMSQLTSYGEAMREEFDRATSIIPKTGEEAEALASHLENLGDDMRSNITALRETQVAMQQLKIDSLTSIGDYYLQDLDNALDGIEKRIELLSKDNKEDYTYTNKILSMERFLPTRSNQKESTSKRRGADQDVIESEQETQDTLNDILETQIKKNDKLREDERQRLLENMETMRQETALKLQAAQVDYDAHSQQIQAITDTFTSYVTNAVNNMNLVIPKPDTTKFTDAAKDIKESLEEIDVLLGGTPGAYAKGTPSGNAKASKLGIAGENYKPEILIDKKTGETTYIDSPTLIDTSKTDVVGEKATANLPKFAKGTLGDDITSAHHFANKMYEGLSNVVAGIKGYGAVAAARKYLGLPYVWGGTDGNGVDCSGLTYLAWKLMGVDIGRTTYQQYPNTSRISRDQLRPGDLVFTNFGADGLDGPGHVGMYIGNGRVIESPSTGDVVKITSNLDRWTDYGRPRYACGTPNGNAQACKLGIAGENFKPEILIDKATGKRTYIDKPTVIDTTKTDVVGERATANLPKFAEGTISPDDIVKYIKENYPEITDVGIAALLANIEQESSFNPKAKTVEAYGGGSNKKVSRWGLFQLDDTRISNWSDIVKNGTWQQQIDTALAEGRYSNSGMGNLSKYNVWDNVLTNSNLTASEAAKKFDELYERSDGKSRDKRAQNAEKYLKQIAGNTDSIDANTKTIQKSQEELDIEEIQKTINDSMDVINKESAQANTQLLKIENDSSLDNDEKMYRMYGVYRPVAQDGARIAYEAYDKLFTDFIEWNDAVSSGQKDWSQETYDAYVDGLDALKDKAFEFEEGISDIFDDLISNLEDELSKIDNYIDKHNTYNDWADIGDSEFRATFRQLLEIDKMNSNGGFAGRESEYRARRDETEQKLYSLGIDKLTDAIEGEIEAHEEIQNEFKKTLEANKEELEKQKENISLDISKLGSLSTLLQQYHSVINSISDAQHEINKELATSKTMYEYLDEDTRKLLFNQEDYNILNEELLRIQDEAVALQRKYEKDIASAKTENIAEITSHYQMQYSLLMKSYEISKADLEVAKKKQQLNNVLNERNVRMFVDGQWRWVADTKEVERALTEYQEAEYQKGKAETSLTQQTEVNSLQADQDSLGTESARIDSRINKLDESIERVDERTERFRKSFDKIQEVIEGEQQTVSEVLKEIGSTNLPQFSKIIDACALEMNKLLGVGGDFYGDNYLSDMANVSSEEEVLRLNKERNEKIDFLNLDEYKMSDKEAFDFWLDSRANYMGEILNFNLTEDNLREFGDIVKSRNDKVDLLKKLGIITNADMLSEKDAENLWNVYHHDYMSDIFNTDWTDNKDGLLKTIKDRDNKIDYLESLGISTDGKKLSEESLVFFDGGSFLIPVEQEGIFDNKELYLKINETDMSNFNTIADSLAINTATLIDQLNSAPLQSIDQSVDNSYHVYFEKLEVDKGVVDIDALRRNIATH